MTLTRAGIGCLAAGFTAVVLGRILGLAEIAGLGIAGLLLPLLSLITLSLRRIPLELSRTVEPTSVIAGDDVVVTVRAVGSGVGRSPAVSLEEVVRQPPDDPRMARLPMRALAPGESEEAAYRLTTERRGVCTLEGMTVTRTDPCGLARRRRPGPGSTEFLVLPRVEQILPPLLRRDADEHAAITGPSLLGSEFASLRDYEPGDDLRKVHWPTSARRGTLVVRRDEQVRQPCCVVLLDVRVRVHDDQTLERAVTAAASILVAAAASGQRIRLCVTDGFDSTNGVGREHLRTLLGKLATVQADPRDSTPDRLRRDAVVCVTTPAGADSLLPTLPRAFVVAFEPTGPISTPGGGSTRGIRIGPDDTFRTVWNQATTLERSAVGATR